MDQRIMGKGIRDMENKKIRKKDSNSITRAYLDSLLVEQRLIDSELPDLTTTIFGKEYRTPIMNAAFSHLHSYCEDAAAEMAKGIKEAGALNWWGMSNDAEMESIFATGCDTVKIIKPFADEKKIFHDMEHAISHGAVAVGMDLDHAYDRSGHYDNVMGEEMRPKTLTQIREYVKATGDVPFVIKGVLSLQDAQKCAEAGVKGIMISHHHGIFDYAVPPLMILPEIKEAVGDELGIFVDCGMDSGMDVFKALALGASAVSVSRHLLEYLKNGQAQAVTERMNEMAGELRSIMARCGCSGVENIDQTIIRQRVEF